MRLTKQTSHGIRILIACALAGDDLLKVADISDRLDLTRQNAFKIVHLLSRAGFIASVRGPNGDIKLARPASDIKISDVVMALETTSVEVAGETREATDGSGTSALTRVFDDALAAFVSVLSAHTLDEMVAAHRPRPQRAQVSVRSGKAADWRRQTPRSKERP